ncbi:MAG: VWA domain-containing protein [Acidovorax sp.]|uniref:vWA domain-containing protein n=1 Tax=Acidovorax sp. TaxID=1872122 RepID=UPI002606A14A|nr:vWA domain-containing protein [Acidovorax sp.]MDH4418651.1 VWA domain-containing protein [Acidovorax sp.]
MPTTTPLRHKVLSRAVALALAVNFAMPPAWMTAQAANHQLTHVRDVNIVDYVVNVDWDFDNPPSQVGNAAQRLDRAYITEVIRVMARSKFTATEGRHRVGHVFVYKNGKFGNNVDIRLLNSEGRSSANVSGWGSRGATSNNHLGFQGTFESVDALGKVINHELGHYTYGLYDEYVEEGAPLKTDDPGSPSGRDTPKNTAMNNHLQFVTLSTPADYRDASQRQTAQARMMATSADGSGGSAWEMLSRPAEQDPAQARGQGRTFFEAFRGVNPQTLELKRPADGFDADLRMVFAPEPVFRDVIVVDRTLPAARLADLVQAAKTLVGQSAGDVQFAVVTSPGDAAALVFTTADTAGKQALTAALDAIQPVPDGTFNGLAAFTQAYKLIAGVRQPGDLATLHLLTGAETQLPQEAVTTARTARVSVNALGLSGGDAQARTLRTKQAQLQSVAGASVNLSQASSLTGGSYNVARNGAEASKDASRAYNEAHANPVASVRGDGSAPLKAGSSFSSKFRVASPAVDGDVEVETYFDPADAAKLSFSLTAPDGKVYTPTTPTAGVGFEADAAEGVMLVRISSQVPGRAGVWSMAVTARADMVDGLGLDVSSASRMQLAAYVLGGTSDKAQTPPVLRATLGGDKRVKGAVVNASIYDEEGTLLADSLALRDDGVAPDIRAGDGEYTVSLKGLLKPGEYYAVLQAVNDGSARLASLGALVKGARNEELPVEAFEREVEVAFSLDASAAGVIGTPEPAPTPTPGASSPDEGGGCTVNPAGRDASMLLLLGWALAALAMRWRRRQG